MIMATITSEWVIIIHNYMTQRFKIVAVTDPDHLLHSIAPEVFDESITGEYLTGYLASPHTMLYLAFHNHKIIGQIQAFIQLHPDKPADLYIDNLGVTPEFQRYGVGTQLIAAVLKAGRERGCRSAWLSAEADNEVVRAFYTAQSFRGKTMLLFESKSGLFDD